MSSASSERPLFYADAALRESPREWQESSLVLPESLGDWRGIRAWAQGGPLTVSCRLVDGKERAVVPWRRAGPGRHRIEAQNGETRWQKHIEIEPETIDRAAFAAMLEDLAHRLPASIALSLQQAGANLPIERTALDRPTLAEELERLRRLVRGRPDNDQPGLAAVLRSIGQSPLTRLAREAEIRPVERSLRPDLTRLGPLLASLPLDSRCRPRRLVDMRPIESFDTPENRFAAHFARLAARRLRRLMALAKEVKELNGQDVAELSGELNRAVGSFPQLAGLRPLAAPPASQAMLRLAPYRRTLGLWRRFRQSLAATLEDRRLDAPGENLPALYELWCALSVIDGALDALASAGWSVESQQLVGKTTHGFGVRALPPNQPAAAAVSADGRLRLEIRPQASASLRGKPLSSVSHEMVPDTAVLLWAGGELASVLVFDAKYKRDGQRPFMADIDKMHTYRDAIRDATGRRIVRYATIVYPGEENFDYAGKVGAVSAVPGRTSPADVVREKISAAISQIEAAFPPEAAATARR